MRSFSIGAVLVLFAAAVATPQGMGNLHGTVYDPSGRVVSGAEVGIVASATGITRNVSSDSRGYYVAPLLPPGTYQVEAKKEGFLSQLRREIEVTAGRGAQIDFHLELGSMTETVEVTAKAPLIGTSASDWGGTIDEQQLESLPLNGRDLFDLTAQKPGVHVATNAAKTVFNGFGMSISVQGARPNQNSFRLDGIYMNDATSLAPASAAGRLLGLESIQELSLIDSPFSAEYGHAAGAVLTAVSRSGANEFHGSAYEFLRNSALDAKNYFDDAGSKIPPLRKNQFGGLLGGPIRKDRAFFIVNYEGIRETGGRTEFPTTLTREAREGRLPGGTVQVAPEVRRYLDLYPLPNGADLGDGTAVYVHESVRGVREDFVSAKVDLAPADKLRLFGRYTFDSAASEYPDSFEIWNLASDSRYQFAHMNAQWLASPHTIHDFRVGFSRVRNAESSDFLADVPESLGFIPGQPMGAIRVTGLAELGTSGDATVRTRPRWNVVNDYQIRYEATHTGGGHTLRFGGAYDRMQYNQRSDLSADGFYRFSSVTDFLLGKTRSGELIAPGSDSIRGWRVHQISGFVLDEFRLAPTLSLNIGVRYEFYTPPSEVNGKIAVLPDPLVDTQMRVGGPLFRNPSKRNFAPRASLAWDPTGDGRTVIRVGAGIFFDLVGTKEVVIGGVRTPPFFRRLIVSNAPFPNLAEAAEADPPPDAPDMVDFNQQQPYVGRWQFTIQRQIGASFVLSAGYAGSRGIHLSGLIGDINTVRPITLADGQLYFPQDVTRPNPQFERIKIRTSAFDSFYHGLTAGVEKRWSDRFRFGANYTWSKSIDDNSSVIQDDFGASDFPTAFNYRLHRGLSDFDVRHVFTANFSYQLPQAGKGAVAAIAGGWELHGIVQARTGLPFHPVVGFDRIRLTAGEGNDAGQRPTFIGEPGSDVVLGDPSQYFDPPLFALPGPGYLGNLGRNTITGPGLAYLDLALHKYLWHSERHSVQLRLEGFNITNHPNFQNPSDRELFNSRGQRLASAGRITSTSTTSRQVQIAVKWTF